MSKATTEFQLSEVVREDVPTIRRVALDAQIDAWSVNGYLEELESPEAFFWKASIDGEIVGFLLARKVPGQKGTDIDLYNIAVNESDRRLGIGGALLERLIDAAERASVGSIWLEVRESNTAAIRTYEIYGFKVESNRRDFYSNPVENALFMRYKIDR